ncbi:MAG: peptidase domain-containing ABC transporter [Synechococcaceae bacterium WB9_2_112]|nr:peptidase domain-containing ABC transporter [Synechococcaceae bacterium WB9_2_112]
MLALRRGSRRWPLLQTDPHPCVRQHDEEDCGAACVATVAQVHGQRLPLARVRQMVGTTQHGTTLLGLRRGAEALGFVVRAARAEPSLLDDLETLPLPLICHWDGNHWVVLHGRDREGLLQIADPAVGLRQLSSEAFLSHWRNGVVLLLEPDPARWARDTHSDDPLTRQGVWVFARFLKPFQPLLLQALGLNLVIGVMALSMPLLLQVLTDDVLVRGDGGMLAALSIGLLLLFALRSLFSFMQGLMVGHFGQKLQLQMVLHYGQRLLHLPLDYFEGRRSGEVVSRLDDIQQLNQLFGNLVLGLPSQLCMALISLAWMLSYSLWLTLASLLGFIAVLLAQLAVVPALQRKTRSLLAQSAQNQGFLVELFRASSLLKSTEATGQAWQELQRNFSRLAHLSWGTQLLDLKAQTATSLLGSCTSILLLWYGSSFVLSEQLSIGQLLAFNGMGANVLAFLAALGGLCQEMVTSQLVIRRLSDVMDHPVEEAHGPSRHVVTLMADDDIVCEGLVFHHPGRCTLIDQLDLRLPGGKVTALVGESGCGKSTLSKLIAGLYRPQSGVIRYGPYSSVDLDPASLRQQVVLVPQETTFLNRTIFENFVFTHPGIRFEQVQQLCALTLADDFIRELPDGYQTVLGEFGVNLSGGQRQRLALARALVGDPAVLILDESTSALDPVLEGRLIERLLDHRRGATTLVISHRPGLIVRCDWIVYLERGQVRAQNTPGQLRATPGVAPFLQPAG